MPTALIQQKSQKEETNVSDEEEEMNISIKDFPVKPYTSKGFSAVGIQHNLSSSLA